MKPHFVWLASYPKSGNTWFRIFLQNLLSDHEQPCNINQLKASAHSAEMSLFQAETGHDPTLFHPDELERLRPSFYRYLHASGFSTAYLKVHDANLLTPSGEPLYPPEVTRAALYFIRNPLDVCVSYAHHKGGVGFDAMVAQMADEQCCIGVYPRAPGYQMRQRLSSWSGHVTSWVDCRAFPLLVLRYEDLVRDPYSFFSMAVDFLQLNKPEASIRKAIDFSSFEELRRQEQESGFSEKPIKADAFFRSGQVGSWRTRLSCAQVERMISDQGALMARFGYLDEAQAFLASRSCESQEQENEPTQCVDQWDRKTSFHSG